MPFDFNKFNSELNRLKKKEEDDVLQDLLGPSRKTIYTSDAYEHDEEGKRVRDEEGNYVIEDPSKTREVISWLDAGKLRELGYTENDIAHMSSRAAHNWAALESNKRAIERQEEQARIWDMAERRNAAANAQERSRLREDLISDATEKENFSLADKFKSMSIWDDLEDMSLDRSRASYDSDNKNQKMYGSYGNYYLDVVPDQQANYYIQENNNKLQMLNGLVDDINDQLLNAGVVGRFDKTTGKWTTNKDLREQKKAYEEQIKALEDENRHLEQRKESRVMANGIVEESGSKTTFRTADQFHEYVAAKENALNSQADSTKALREYYQYVSQYGTRSDPDKVRELADAAERASEAAKAAAYKFVDDYDEVTKARNEELDFDGYMDRAQQWREKAAGIRAMVLSGDTSVSLADAEAFEEKAKTLEQAAMTLMDADRLQEYFDKADKTVRRYEDILEDAEREFKEQSFGDYSTANILFRTDKDEYLSYIADHLFSGSTEEAQAAIMRMKSLGDDPFRSAANKDTLQAQADQIRSAMETTNDPAVYQELEKSLRSVEEQLTGEDTSQSMQNAIDYWTRAFVQGKIGEAKSEREQYAAEFGRRANEAFEKTLNEEGNEKLKALYEKFIDAAFSDDSASDESVYSMNSQFFGGSSVKTPYQAALANLRNALKEDGQFTDQQIKDIIEFNRQAAREFKANQEEEWVKKYMTGKGKGIYGTLASVATNLASGLGFIEAIRMKYFNGSHYQLVDVNAEVFAPYRITKTIRDNVTETMGKWDNAVFGGKPIFTQAYGILTSSADSMAAMYLGMGIGGALSMGGASAAFASAAAHLTSSLSIGLAAGTETIVDLTERGFDAGAALWGGVSAAIFESLFETVSLSQLEFMQEVGNVQRLFSKDFVINMAKSFGGNASEEAATELANHLYDTWVHGDRSEWADLQRQYHDDYMSYIFDPSKSDAENEEAAWNYARKMASKNVGEKVFEAAWTGGLQGLLMGAGGFGIAQLKDKFNLSEAGKVVKTDYSKMNNADLRNHYRESILNYQSVAAYCESVSEDGVLSKRQEQMLAESEQHMKDVGKELENRDMSAVTTGEGVKVEGYDGAYYTINYGDKSGVQRYYGDVKDGKPNGIGASWSANGNIFYGSWQDGKLVKGIVYLQDGQYRMIQPGDNGLDISEAKNFTDNETSFNADVLVNMAADTYDSRGRLVKGTLHSQADQIRAEMQKTEDPAKLLELGEQLDKVEARLTEANEAAVEARREQRESESILLPMGSVHLPSHRMQIMQIIAEDPGPSAEKSAPTANASETVASRERGVTAGTESAAAAERAKQGLVDEDHITMHQTSFDEYSKLLAEADELQARIKKAYEKSQGKRTAIIASDEDRLVEVKRRILFLEGGKQKKQSKATGKAKEQQSDNKTARDREHFPGETEALYSELRQLSNALSNPELTAEQKQNLEKRIRNIEETIHFYETGEFLSESAELREEIAVIMDKLNDKKLGTQEKLALRDELADLQEQLKKAETAEDGAAAFEKNEKEVEKNKGNSSVPGENNNIEEEGAEPARLEPEETAPAEAPATELSLADEYRSVPATEIYPRLVEDVTSGRADLEVALDAIQAVFDNLDIDDIRDRIKAELAERGKSATPVSEPDSRITAIDARINELKAQIDDKKDDMHAQYEILLEIDQLENEKLSLEGTANGGQDQSGVRPELSGSPGRYDAGGADQNQAGGRTGVQENQGQIPALESDASGLLGRSSDDTSVQPGSVTEERFARILAPTQDEIDAQRTLDEQELIDAIVAEKGKEYGVTADDFRVAQDIAGQREGIPIIVMRDDAAQKMGTDSMTKRFVDGEHKGLVGIFLTESALSDLRAHDHERAHFMLLVSDKWAQSVTNNRARTFISFTQKLNQPFYVDGGDHKITTAGQFVEWAAQHNGIGLFDAANFSKLAPEDQVSIISEAFAMSLEKVNPKQYKDNPLKQLFRDYNAIYAQYEDAKKNLAINIATHQANRSGGNAVQRAVAATGVHDERTQQLASSLLGQRFMLPNRGSGQEGYAKTVANLQARFKEIVQAYQDLLAGRGNYTYDSFNRDAGRYGFVADETGLHLKDVDVLNGGGGALDALLERVMMTQAAVTTDGLAVNYLENKFTLQQRGMDYRYPSVIGYKKMPGLKTLPPLMPNDGKAYTARQMMAMVDMPSVMMEGVDTSIYRDPFSSHVPINRKMAKTLAEMDLFEAANILYGVFGIKTDSDGNPLLEDDPKTKQTKNPTNSQGQACSVYAKHREELLWNAFNCALQDALIDLHTAIETNGELTIWNPDLNPDKDGNPRGGFEKIKLRETVQQKRLDPKTNRIVTVSVPGRLNLEKLNLYNVMVAELQRYMDGLDGDSVMRESAPPVQEDKLKEIVNQLIMGDEVSIADLNDIVEQIKSENGSDWDRVAFADDGSIDYSDPDFQAMLYDRATGIINGVFVEVDEETDEDYGDTTDAESTYQPKASESRGYVDGSPQQKRVERAESIQRASENKAKRTAKAAEDADYEATLAATDAKDALAKLEDAIRRGKEQEIYLAREEYQQAQENHRVKEEASRQAKRDAEEAKQNILTWPEAMARALFGSSVYEEGELEYGSMHGETQSMGAETRSVRPITARYDARDDGLAYARARADAFQTFFTDPEVNSANQLSKLFWSNGRKVSTTRNSIGNLNIEAKALILKELMADINKFGSQAKLEANIDLTKDNVSLGVYELLSKRIEMNDGKEMDFERDFGSQELLGAPIINAMKTVELAADYDMMTRQDLKLAQIENGIAAKGFNYKTNRDDFVNKYAVDFEALGAADGKEAAEAYLDYRQAEERVYSLRRHKPKQGSSKATIQKYTAKVTAAVNQSAQLRTRFTDLLGKKSMYYLDASDLAALYGNTPVNVNEESKYRKRNAKTKDFGKLEFKRDKQGNIVDPNGFMTLQMQIDEQVNNIKNRKIDKAKYKDDRDQTVKELRDVESKIRSLNAVKSNGAVAFSQEYNELVSQKEELKASIKRYEEEMLRQDSRIEANKQRIKLLMRGIDSLVEARITLLNSEDQQQALGNDTSVGTVQQNKVIEDSNGVVYLYTPKNVAFDSRYNLRRVSNGSTITTAEYQHDLYANDPYYLWLGKEEFWKDAFIERFFVTPNKPVLKAEEKIAYQKNRTSEYEPVRYADFNRGEILLKVKNFIDKANEYDRNYFNGTFTSNITGTYFVPLENIENAQVGDDIKLTLVDNEKGVNGKAIRISDADGKELGYIENKDKRFFSIQAALEQKRNIEARIKTKKEGINPHDNGKTYYFEAEITLGDRDVPVTTYEELLKMSLDEMAAVPNVLRILTNNGHDIEELLWWVHRYNTTFDVAAATWYSKNRYSMWDTYNRAQGINDDNFHLWSNSEDLAKNPVKLNGKKIGLSFENTDEIDQALRITNERIEQNRQIPREADKQKNIQLDRELNDLEALRDALQNAKQTFGDESIWHRVEVDETGKPIPIGKNGEKVATGKWVWRNYSDLERAQGSDYGTSFDNPNIRENKRLEEELREARQVSDFVFGEKLIEEGFIKPTSGVGIQDLNELRRWIKEHPKTLFKFAEDIWTTNDYGQQTADLTDLLSNNKISVYGSIYDMIPGLDDFQVVLGKPENTMFSQHFQLKAYDDKKTGTKHRVIILDQDDTVQEKYNSLMMAISVLGAYQKDDYTFDIPWDPLADLSVKRYQESQLTEEDRAKALQAKKDRLTELLVAGAEKIPNQLGFRMRFKAAVAEGKAYEFLMSPSKISSVDRKKLLDAKDGNKNFIFGSEIRQDSAGNEYVVSEAMSLFNQIQREENPDIYEAIDQINGKDYSANGKYVKAAAAFAAYGFHVSDNVDQAVTQIKETMIHRLLSNNMLRRLGVYGLKLSDVLEHINGETDSHMLDQDTFEKLFNGERIEGLQVTSEDYGTKYAKELRDWYAKSKLLRKDDPYLGAKPEPSAHVAALREAYKEWARNGKVGKKPSAKVTVTLTGSANEQFVNAVLLTTNPQFFGYTEDETNAIIAQYLKDKEFDALAARLRENFRSYENYKRAYYPNKNTSSLDATLGGVGKDGNPVFSPFNAYKDSYFQHGIKAPYERVGRQLESAARAIATITETDYTVENLLSDLAEHGDISSARPFQSAEAFLAAKQHEISKAKQNSARYDGDLRKAYPFITSIVDFVLGEYDKADVKTQLAFMQQELTSEEESINFLQKEIASSEKAHDRELKYLRKLRTAYEANAQAVKQFRDKHNLKAEEPKPTLKSFVRDALKNADVTIGKVIEDPIAYAKQFASDPAEIMRIAGDAVAMNASYLKALKTGLIEKNDDWDFKKKLIAYYHDQEELSDYADTRYLEGERVLEAEARSKKLLEKNRKSVDDMLKEYRHEHNRLYFAVRNALSSADTFDYHMKQLNYAKSAYLQSVVSTISNFVDAFDKAYDEGQIGIFTAEERVLTPFEFDAKDVAQVLHDMMNRHSYAELMDMFRDADERVEQLGIDALIITCAEKLGYLSGIQERVEAYDNFSTDNRLFFNVSYDNVNYANTVQNQYLGSEVYYRDLHEEATKILERYCADVGYEGGIYKLIADINKFEAQLNNTKVSDSDEQTVEARVMEPGETALVASLKDLFRFKQNDGISIFELPKNVQDAFLALQLADEHMAPNALIGDTYDKLYPGFRSAVSEMLKGTSYESLAEYDPETIIALLLKSELDFSEEMQRPTKDMDRREREMSEKKLGVYKALRDLHMLLMQDENYEETTHVSVERSAVKYVGAETEFKGTSPEKRAKYINIINGSVQAYLESHLIEADSEGDNVGKVTHLIVGDSDVNLDKLAEDVLGSMNKVSKQMLDKINAEIRSDPQSRSEGFAALGGLPSDRLLPRTTAARNSFYNGYFTLIEIDSQYGDPNKIEADNKAFEDKLLEEINKTQVESLMANPSLTLRGEDLISYIIHHKIDFANDENVKELLCEAMKNRIQALRDKADNPKYNRTSGTGDRTSTVLGASKQDLLEAIHIYNEAVGFAYCCTIDAYLWNEKNEGYLAVAEAARDYIRQYGMDKKSAKISSQIAIMDNAATADYAVTSLMSKIHGLAISMARNGMQPYFGTDVALIYKEDRDAYRRGQASGDMSEFDKLIKDKKKLGLYKQDIKYYRECIEKGDTIGAMQTLRLIDYFGLQEEKFVEYRNLLNDKENARGQDQKTRREARQAVEKAYKQMMRHIGNAVRSNYSGWKRAIGALSAWRYAAMLLAPTTHMANMTSTAMNIAMHSASDAMRFGYEQLMIKAGKMDQSEATVSYVNRWKDSELFALADREYQDSASRMIYSVNRLGSMISDALREAGPIFQRANFSGIALEMEDHGMGYGVFRKTFASLLKARGITAEQYSGMDVDSKAELMSLAVGKTQDALFRNLSLASKGLMKLSNTWLGKLMLNPLAPFMKMAGNLVTASIKLSPLGYFGAIYHGVMEKVYQKVEAKGEISSEWFLRQVQTIAKNVHEQNYSETDRKSAQVQRITLATAGTLAALIGYFGRAIGWITPGDDDDDEERMNTQNGHRAYALRFGKTEVSMSRLFPAGLSLLLGAKIYELVENAQTEGFNGSDLIKLGDAFLETYADNTIIGDFAQSIKRYSDAAKYCDYVDEEGLTVPFLRKLGAVVTTHATNFLTQLNPGILKTIENIFVEGGTTDTFFYDKNSKVPYGLQYLWSDFNESNFFNDYNRIAQRDLVYNEKPSETIGDYAIRVLIGDFSRANEPDYSGWLTDLAEATYKDEDGNVHQYSSRVIYPEYDKYIDIDGKHATKEETDLYYSVMNTELNKFYSDLTYNLSFQSLDNEGKAVVIEKMIAAARAKANLAVVKERGDDEKPDVYTGNDYIGNGTINLHDLPIVVDADGDWMTTLSYTIKDNDGKWVNIPGILTIDGTPQEVDEQTAVDAYYKTHQHFGKFNSKSRAEAAAYALHLEQEAYYNPSKSDFAKLINNDKDFVDYAIMDYATKFLTNKTDVPDFALLDQALNNWDSYSPIVQNVMHKVSGFDDLLEAYQDSRVDLNTYIEFDKRYKAANSTPTAQNYDILSDYVRNMDKKALDYFVEHNGKPFEKIKEVVKDKHNYDLTQYMNLRDAQNALFTLNEGDKVKATPEEIAVYDMLKRDAPSTLVDLVTVHNDNKKLDQANKAGYSTATFFKVKDEYNRIDKLDLTQTDKHDKYLSFLDNTFAGDRTKIDFFANLLTYSYVQPVETKKDTFIQKWNFNDASAQTASDLINALQPINGYETVRDCQKIVALDDAYWNGQLRSLGWDDEQWKKFMYEYMRKVYNKDTYESKLPNYRSAIKYYRDQMSNKKK